MDAADGLRGAADALRPEAGEELMGLVRELYPICRSITGEGLRASLRALRRLAPLELHELPTGTRVFDWTVPREWNLRAARLVSPRGEVVADAQRLSLEVVNYSAPFHGRVSLEALQPHLHSLPEQPTLVPYRTTYYREDWGFCLPHARRAALEPGEYDVLVDTTLSDGSLTWGEVVVPGRTDREILVSTHCCHPSLANDNLAGMVVAAALAREVARHRPRHTFRFLFVPGTIGAISWLATHEREAFRVAHGLVLACLGDAGRLTYKRSRRGDAAVDRAAAHVLGRCGDDHELRPFTPYGYDERQYCSPGFDLPVGALTRTPHGEYPEYHTSGDSPALVRPDRLVDSLRRILEIFEVLEGDRTYLNLSPKCEPQLGRRGLYGSLGGASHAEARQLAMLWVLNQSDGGRSLLEIAERAGIPFTHVLAAARALERAELLREAAAGERASAVREPTGGAT
jgi:aminopeptidase-like protein